MPVVQTTLIEGYDAETKSRLAKALTRAVRSVIAAPLEAVIVIMSEVHPTSYARGGVSRIPGPPLRPAVEVARDFAAAIDAGDSAAAAALAAPDFTAAGPGPEALDLARYQALLKTRYRALRRTYQGFDEALTDEGSVVIGHGVLEATLADGGVHDQARFVDRFLVRADRVVSMTSWIAAG